MHHLTEIYYYMSVLMINNNNFILFIIFNVPTIIMSVFAVIY